jgi:Hydrazine synthase alpha subunit middle domain
MRSRLVAVVLVTVSLIATVVSLPAQQSSEPVFRDRLKVEVPHISTDPTIRYDFDIVYVRAPRRGDDQGRFYPDFSAPVTMEPGADLMLLHPDGREELLVAGKNGSITDPVVSFDGQWVYYVHLHDLREANQWSPPAAGADIYKIHLATRKIVRLTNQTFTPNTGAANWSRDYRAASDGWTSFGYGVYNMGPYPLPGGKVVFTSNRDGFKPAKGYPAVALQLFVMDDSDTGLGTNVEKIGHFNLAGALHPVTLADGRVMFSSLESQGIRNDILWGIWTIHPDGTNWAPLVSAFDTVAAPSGFHFQTQLSDGSIVVEEYYNQNNSGFGSLIKLPPSPPKGFAAFGPAHRHDPRNQAWRIGRYDDGKGKWYTMPFMPTGSISLTPFAHGQEGPADTSVLGDKNSARVGKFTHPSGAPDNHLLVVYSPGPVNHQYRFLPQVDGGIYLARGGAVVNEPAELRLIKNDPRYNESWPRAVVPYRRIYGVDEPARLPALKNDGRASPHLPEGAPFGLVGSSSMYKRESYPNGVVRPGSVTAGYAGGNDPWKGLDPFTSRGHGMPLNLHNQGGDVGLFANSDIHAIRILAMEPTTDRHRGKDAGPRYLAHVRERLRILGEIPLRKFGPTGQPLDPDGNPDTSFLARIPADTGFTFQLLDRRGMVLVHSQTWHQLRPGETRTNCGGCHAHSQPPTDFAATAAGRPDYAVWDLVNRTPLLTAKAGGDPSGQRWDTDDSTGLRFAERDRQPRFSDVEYLRDVRPILQKSCVACHSRKKGTVAADLDLDADDERVRIEHVGEFPGTYYRLALDEKARGGFKPVGWDSWGYPNGSRYVRQLQARRSLLIWKVFGQRLDGFSNDDFASEKEPGSGQLFHKGQPVHAERYKANQDLDYIGQPMPPPEAVAGRAVGPDGRPVKVEPLTDEDRLTLVRWIDLGCPIDLDGRRGRANLGWHLDDTRPTLTLTEPRADATDPIRRILVGMHDYHSGLDMATFVVKASFPVGGTSAGKNLAGLFRPKSQGVWELLIDPPVTSVTQEGGRLEVSVSDRQGNITRIERVLRPRR